MHKTPERRRLQAQLERDYWNPVEAQLNVLRLNVLTLLLVCHRRRRNNGTHSFRGRPKAVQNAKPDTTFGGSGGILPCQNDMPSLSCLLKSETTCALFRQLKPISAGLCCDASYQDQPSWMIWMG